MINYSLVSLLGPALSGSHTTTFVAKNRIEMDANAIDKPPAHFQNLQIWRDRTIHRPLLHELTLHRTIRPFKSPSLSFLAPLSRW